ECNAQSVSHRERLYRAERAWMPAINAYSHCTHDGVAHRYRHPKKRRSMSSRALLIIAPMIPAIAAPARTESIWPPLDETNRMYEPMPLSADASNSAPITTINPIAAEMRIPVKMNGAALGRLIRRRWRFALGRSTGRSGPQWDQRRGRRRRY